MESGVCCCIPEAVGGDDGHCYVHQHLVQEILGDFEADYRAVGTQFGILLHTAKIFVQSRVGD